MGEGLDPRLVIAQRFDEELVFAKDAELLEPSLGQQHIVEIDRAGRAALRVQSPVVRVQPAQDDRVHRPHGVAHDAEVVGIDEGEILLETEEEAKGILKQVRGGADFAKLAQEKTIRTSAKDSGGDLGEFTRPRYPELFDAAVKLSKGKVDGPIKIQDRQFGESFAVIELTSKTEENVQPLEEVKDRLTRMARQEKDNNLYKNWIAANGQRRNVRHAKKYATSLRSYYRYMLNVRHAKVTYTMWMKTSMPVFALPSLLRKHPISRKPLKASLMIYARINLWIAWYVVMSVLVKPKLLCGQLL